MSIAAHFGFGQDLGNVQQDHISTAILLESIGQTCVVLGMAVAKMSLGFFFLRIVQDRWQRILIWGVMLLLLLASLTCSLFFWLHCEPYHYLWDHSIPGGRCGLPLLPSAYVLAVVCILTDFFFAIYPWLIMWGFTMNKREKYVILGSMSLGIM